MNPIKLDITKNFGRVYGGNIAGGYYQNGNYFRPDGRYYGKSPDVEDTAGAVNATPLPEPPPPIAPEREPEVQTMHPKVKQIISLPAAQIITAVNSVIAEAQEKGEAIKPEGFTPRLEDTEEAKRANAEFLLANTDLGAEETSQ